MIEYLVVFALFLFIAWIGYQIGVVSERNKAQAELDSMKNVRDFFEAAYQCRRELSINIGRERDAWCKSFARELERRISAESERDALKKKLERWEELEY